jgi:A/G-specific adenine glycosylase
VVDGNVYRVLSRHFGIDTPINSTEGKKIFTALSQSLIPRHQASAYNQAIMDFGAMQCTPQSPRCIICPLQETCDALHTGRIDTLPVKLKKLEIKTRHFIYIYIRCRGYVAIHRRGAGDILQGLWEPLLIENGPLPAFDGAMTLLRSNVKHVLTHRIIFADFYLLETNERPSLPSDYIWIPEIDLTHYALPRLIELLIEKLPDDTGEIKVDDAE